MGAGASNASILSGLDPSLNYQVNSNESLLCIDYQGIEW